MSVKHPGEHESEEETFLHRWSRRKRGVAAEEAAVEESPAVPVAPEAEAKAELTDADMPPLETLDENADYSGFFSPKVSEELRQLALQQLFRNACFNVCDGLDDYAEDFTQFETLGDVITSDMRHRLQREAERLAEQATGEAPEGTAERSPATEAAEPLSAKPVEPPETQLVQQPAQKEGGDATAVSSPSDTPDESREKRS